MAEPDRPLSKRNLHPDCAQGRLEGWLRWGNLWAYRDSPDFPERVAAFLAAWQGDTHPGSVRAA